MSFAIAYQHNLSLLVFSVKLLQQIFCYLTLSFITVQMFIDQFHVMDFRRLYFDVFIIIQNAPHLTYNGICKIFTLVDNIF